MMIFRGILLNKSLNLQPKLAQLIQISTWPTNITLHLRPFWLQTLFQLIAIHARDRFQASVRCHAVQLEYEQTPCSATGCE